MDWAKFKKRKNTPRWSFQQAPPLRKRLAASSHHAIKEASKKTKRGFWEYIALNRDGAQEIAHLFQLGWNELKHPSVTKAIGVAAVITIVLLVQLWDTTLPLQPVGGSPSTLQAEIVTVPSPGTTQNKPSAIAPMSKEERLPEKTTEAPLHPASEEKLNRNEAPAPVIQKESKATKPLTIQEPKWVKSKPQKKRVLTKRASNQAKAAKKKTSKQKKVRQPSLAVIADRFENTESLPKSRFSAWDDTAPLNRMALLAFREASMTPVFHPNPLLSAVEWEPEFTVEYRIATEPVLREVLGSVQEEDFAEIREQLEDFKQETKAIALKAVPKESAVALVKKATSPPEPELIRPVKSKGKLVSPEVATEVIAKIRQNSAPPKAPDPELVVNHLKALAQEAKDPPFEIESEQRLARAPPTLSQTQHEMGTEGEVRPENEFEEPASGDPILLAPTQAGMGLGSQLTTPAVNTQKPTKKKSSSSPVQQASKSKATPTTTEFRKLPNVAMNRAASNPTARAMEGVLMGYVDWDKRVDQWLEEEKGHLQLRLHPFGNPDPQATRYFTFEEYEFPGPKFRKRVDHLKGDFLLIAAFFKQGQHQPQAQVLYEVPAVPEVKAKPVLLNADTQKQHHKFFITYEQFLRAKEKTRVGSPSRASLRTRVLEAISGDPSRGKYTPIAGAKLSIVDQESEWGGPFYSDSLGDVTLSNLSSSSEFRLRVEKEGYYPTETIIPLSKSAEEWAPVYLISKREGTTIPKAFLKMKRGQVEGRAIVAGRLFNPVTGNYQSMDNLTVEMVGRKKGPIYFSENGPFPFLNLSATTKSALFSFYNALPAFRVLKRNGKLSLMLNVKPGTGTFLNWGKGGRKILKGQVIDSANEILPPLSVSVLGDPDYEFALDEDLNFSEVHDLPAGVITLKTEVSGNQYLPMTHTVPSPLRRENITHKLFVLSEKMIRASASRSELSLQPGMGHVIGGIEDEFFEGGRQCVFVKLMKDGVPVESHFGPYPWGYKRKAGRRLCLQKNFAGYGFYNLPPGEYSVKIQERVKQENPSGKPTYVFRTLRKHIARPIQGGVAIVMN